MQQILIASLIVSLNLEFSLLREGKVGGWLIGWISRFVVIFVLGLGSWWFFQPSFTGPLWGYLGAIWAPLLINVIWTTVVAAAENDSRPKYGNVPPIRNDHNWALGLYAIYALIMAITFLIIPATQNQGLRAMMGTVEIVHDNPPSADQDHIRVVPIEAARFDADKLMGSPIQEMGLSTAGSLFLVGEMSVQEIPTEQGTRLVWVAPLEYRDWFKAIAGPYSPGFIVVDAEDPELPAQLHTGFQMRYVETGWWANNLKRHIYTSGYIGYGIREITFMLDDALQPHFVANLTQPTIGFTADQVMLTLVIDPMTGEITPYQFGADTTPHWIERVVPEEVVEARLPWWGSYVHGFVNAMLSERDVILPVSINAAAPDVYLVHHEGQTSWVVGFTSRGNQDSALAGTMYVNSRTGAAQFFTWVPEGQQPPALSNEDDAYDAVEKALAINSGAYNPAQPVMYRIAGRQVYVVPIITEGSNRQEGIAIYDAQSQRTSSAMITKAARKSWY